MKILNADQIRQLDSYTIENEPVASIDLMERAASKCCDWIKRHMRNKRTIRIFCGMGNNGGDGLAMARILAADGYSVYAYKAVHAQNASVDFQVNEKRLETVPNVSYHSIESADQLPGISPDEVVVDALLGSGLTRPVEGLLARIVHHINATGALVVSVDLPSGLFCEDNRENDARSIVRANYTLSFQLPKLAFMFASNEQFSGRWVLIDIGLHPEAIRLAETRLFYLQASDIRALHRPRRKFAHKGHFGHGLLIAGSYGKTGAAILAARAAIRSGAGLCTVQLPNSGYSALQASVPEAMCIPDEHPHFISGVTGLEGYNAVAVGPGIGTRDQTARSLKLLIQNATVPMVLDADALNILSENLTWCGFLPKGSVFTPHPGEFDRLGGKTSSDHDRLEKALELAHRFQVYIVLKGAHTAIVCPDGRCFFNATGNPGMATGGTGDVLTGMILAWLAQNYSPLHSCQLAVYLHGRAGDLAAARKGYEGLAAGDIAEHIPQAMRTTFGPAAMAF